MYFWIDAEKEIYKSYEDLVFDINKKKSISKYVYCSNPYDVLVEIIARLLYGVQIELIDGDLSIEEINRLGILEKDLLNQYEIEKKNFNNVAEIFDVIQKSESWRLAIYTSGTTGRPKKVEHNFKSITRTVRMGERYKDNVWAFAYNVSHFAGLQVFFQAFLNHNTIVYLFESSRDGFESYINKYTCTHISATPTFYRTIIPCIKKALPSIRSITLGGEKFDSTLVGKLDEVFPNAKIHNIYASTEAGSLFAGVGDVFEIPDELQDFIKINDTSELLLHKTIVSNITIQGDWYNTQDIVEIVEPKKIRFVSRSSDMINVGGYKVNPLEVEEEIKKVDGIVDVVIKSRENRILGNLLVAEIVKSDEIDENELKKNIISKLNTRLQKWKIPRMLNFVKKIEKTRSGKKVRK